MKILFGGNNVFSAKLNSQQNVADRAKELLKFYSKEIRQRACFSFHFTYLKVFHRISFTYIKFILGGAAEF
jgi:hypothetical protein